MEWFSLFLLWNWYNKLWYCICIDLRSECTFQIEINNINHDDDYYSDASTIPYAESDVDFNIESDINSDEGYYSNASIWDLALKVIKVKKGR